MTEAVNADGRELTREERAFHLISGHRALDLLATLRDRHREPVECLREPPDLDRWLSIAGLAVPGRPSTRADLADARRLREAVNGVTRAALTGDAPRAYDLRELNRWGARPALAPQADIAFARQWSGDRPVRGALALIAREAIELLTGPDRALIRECAAAPDCSRLYLDRSRAGRRRWCHMEWCGSRAKMASYRQRQASRGT